MVGSSSDTATNTGLGSIIGAGAVALAAVAVGLLAITGPSGEAKFGL